MAVSRRLEHKVAIITGGASGIGEATARLFVENGAFVLIADVQDKLGIRLAKELGVQAAAYIHCDVTVEEEVEAAGAMAMSKWGKLDLMFCNAGIIGRGDGRLVVGEMDMGEFDRVMGVNVRGTAMAVKQAAKAMVKGGGGGSINCTASVASLFGGLVPLNYTAFKHAVVGIMRSAASDLGKYGIRVNCVSPNLILTPLASNFFGQLIGDAHPSHLQSIADSINVLRHRSLTPHDVANAALYLASDDSSFVSGLNLVVDGGMSAAREFMMHA